MKVFNQDKTNHLEQPMFLGDSVNIARYEHVKFPWIDKLTDKQLSFFWRPEEIDLSRDNGEFAELSDHEKHIFTSNLKYQILLDSVQGRSPNLAFLPIVSLPELETWIETWSFAETIHSRSYTHMIRSIYSNPSEVFDTILDIPEIIDRAVTVTAEYDKLLKAIKEDADIEVIEDALFRTMVSVNVLEGVRFYVSFACTFSFGERKLLEGSSKVMKLIARDEALHLSLTQRVIQTWMNGGDGERMQNMCIRNFNYIEECFRDAAEQEKQWADYLFKDGSVIGLNASILKSYVEYITNVRCKALGLGAIFEEISNPLPWMNTWLSSDNVQVAPQETEISSYLTGSLDTSVNEDDFKDFRLDVADC